MSDDNAQCEPPEGLRDRDGWHWVQAPVGEPHLAKWFAASSSRGKPLWDSDQHIYTATPRYAAREWGLRYLAPVATPAEVEALRGERDAALERERQAMSASAKARTDLWLVTEERDGLRAGTDRLLAERNALRGEVEALRLRAEVKRMKAAAAAINEEVCQTLGKVLGYPWLMDDQTNFPGATEVDGVCVGDHVAETLAAEAAERINKLQAEASEWCQSVQLLQDRVHRQKGERDALAIAFRKLSAALRVNMLRHVPDTSHAEIDAAIDACVGPVARTALGDTP